MKIQAFGLELRKVGTLSELYSEVDRTLACFHIPPGSVTSQMQGMACAHALQKMISAENWFDICTIDICAKMCQIVIPVERYRIYHSQHCVSYKEMLPEFRQALIAMVLDDFRPILNPQTPNQ